MDNEKPTITSREVTSVNKPSKVMDAIAIGVEVRLDPFSIYSKIVTQRTIEVARQLGIAEEEIQRWAIAQVKRHSRKSSVIKMVYPELLIKG